MDGSAAVSGAVAALAAERDVDSAQHLSALQVVRRLLSTGVPDYGCNRATQLMYVVDQQLAGT